MRHQKARLFVSDAWLFCGATAWLICANACAPGLGDEDLRFTELMVLPHRPSATRQWVEIHNLSQSFVSLASVRLEATSREGRSHTWRLGRTFLAPNERLVVGGKEAPRVGRVDRALPRFHLPSSGTLRLTVAGRVLDSVTWSRARKMNGPPAETNPVSARWLVLRGQSLVREEKSAWRQPSERTYDGRNQGCPGTAKPPFGACYDEALGTVWDVQAWRAPRLEWDVKNAPHVIAMRAPGAFGSTDLGFIVVEAGPLGNDLLGVRFKRGPLGGQPTRTRTFALPVLGCGALGPWARKVFSVGAARGHPTISKRSDLPRGALGTSWGRYKLVAASQGSVPSDEFVCPPLRRGALWLRDGALENQAEAVVSVSDVGLVVF